MWWSIPGHWKVVGAVQEERGGRQVGGREEKEEEEHLLEP